MISEPKTISFICKDEQIFLLYFMEDINMYDKTYKKEIGLLKISIKLRGLQNSIYDNEKVQ